MNAVHPVIITRQNSTRIVGLWGRQGDYTRPLQ